MRKADLAVVERRITEKRRMTAPASQGTQEVDVPRFLRSRPALTEEQAVEVARLGIALEVEMGRPVDIECAYRGDRLHLLQCRPITGSATSVAS